MHVCVGARSVGVSAGACGVQKRVSEVALEPKASSELPDVGTVFPSSVRAVFTLSHQAVSPALQMTTARHVCKASLSHSLDRGSGACSVPALSEQKPLHLQRFMGGHGSLWQHSSHLPFPHMNLTILLLSPFSKSPRRCAPPKKNNPFDS